MPTPTVSLRIPGEEKEPADLKAASMGLTFTEAAREALGEWTGRPVPVATLKALKRAEEAEAEAARLRDDLTRLRARVAGVTPPPAGTTRADRLAAALEGATPEVPVTRKHLAVMSGLDGAIVGMRMSWLKAHGYVTQPAKGRYVPVPGMDMREGVKKALAEDAAAVRERRRSVPVPGETPAPVPSVPRHVRPLPPGAPVFREAGASPVVGALAPEGKRGRR